MIAEEYWFRYEETARSSYVDACGDICPMDPVVMIHLRRFLVVKHTPQGVRLSVPWAFRGETRFVCRHWRKMFACPTEEEAMQSFIARKKRQLRIYRKRAEIAELAIAVAEGKAYSWQGKIEEVA